MALQHLTRDLRITGLIRAEKADTLHAGEEQEGTDNNQCEDVDGAAQAVAGRGVLAQDRDSYCTLES
jgi:hypothetical protein